MQTADGKGVPIRRPADGLPIMDHQHRVGPEPDRKKMATLGAVYSIDRFRRTPEDVKSLFRDPHEKPTAEHSPPRPHPCHKRMRALLDHSDGNGDEIDGRAAVFGWISDEIAERQAGSGKPIVCVMHGEESLWNMRDVFQANLPMIDILDLLHVTPRLWDAAFCFIRPRMPRRRSSSASGRCEFCGGSGCRHWRVAADGNRARTAVNKHVALQHLRLLGEEPSPYASRRIPGGGPPHCERRDRSSEPSSRERSFGTTGMNWCIPGAQSMLNLRCVYLTDEKEPFMTFHIAE